MIRVAQRTVRDLRRDLFGHVQRCRCASSISSTHGELMSRLTNDVENVNTVLTDSVTQLFCRPAHAWSASPR